ncbi:hypothetical protein BD289DRAFT_437607 [Coniella lustricola]|uniref:Uncharacterized protein n=1 Tax=Coniella lustricola TaxID=2025994 RepID=A0A2T3A3W2_9PEZI|nr:hypothetical protein BD289DRAFT_437607 [Coniella lustricola]
MQQHHQQKGHQYSSSSLYTISRTHSHDGTTSTPLDSATVAALNCPSTSSFPSSAVCSPTSSKLEPRAEKMQHTAGNISSMSKPSASVSTTNTPLLPPNSGVSSAASSVYHQHPRSPRPVSFAFPPRESLDSNVTAATGASSASPPSPPAVPPKISTAAGGITSKSPKLGVSPSKALPGVPLAPPAAAASSASSIKSNTTTNTSQSRPPQHYHSNNPFAPFNTPPNSPARPCRPHDEPLEIPDLVCPSSPALASSASQSPSRPSKTATNTTLTASAQVTSPAPTPFALIAAKTHNHNHSRSNSNSNNSVLTTRTASPGPPPQMALPKIPPGSPSLGTFVASGNGQAGAKSAKQQQQRQQPKQAKNQKQQQGQNNNGAHSSNNNGYGRDSWGSWEAKERP